MKYLVCLCTMILSLNSHAGWKEVKRYAEIKTTESHKIAGSFNWVPMARNALVGHELTASSKIQVTKAIVSVISYDWENEEGCKVDDLDNYKNKRFSSYEYSFQHVDSPEQEWFTTGFSGPLVKCTNGKKIDFSTKAVTAVRH